MHNDACVPWTLHGYILSKTPSGAPNALGRCWTKVTTWGRSGVPKRAFGVCVKWWIRFMCDYRPNQTCATTLPLYGMGHYWLLRLILAWCHITSDGGDLRSLSGRGRAWIGSHDCFHRAPDTPLVPSCMRDSEKGQSPMIFCLYMRAVYQRVDPMLVSSRER